MVSAERRREAEAFIEAVGAWAASRPDLLAAVVVGSWGRDDASEESDIDLVLLTNDPSVYLESEEWINELAPDARLIRTANWGPITERRLLLPSSLEVEVEVEVGVGRPTWAETTPVDLGTRQVVRSGFRPLCDPLGLLASLAANC